MRLSLAIAIALCASTSASNGEPVRTSASGHDYELSCNSNGYILRSKAPVSRFIGQGANTQVLRRTEVIYLGRSCDAYSEVLGGGGWCWANGGFIVDLDGERLGFPRQELLCVEENYYDLGLDCRCE
ncbi:hypothetical protein ACXYMP_06880 [Aliiroseovarius sp. CAU 1755]